MQARAHVVALAVLVALALAPRAFGDDGPTPKGPQAKVPPSIVYGPSRASKAWIETPGGARVAVDEGVTWQGVTVYLSLLWDLIGVDAETGEVLYAVDVGAFWNEIHFTQMKGAGGLVWAVELRPGSRARAGRDKRQFHDLRTGAKIDVNDVGAPEGMPLELREVWHGDVSRIDKPFALLVADAGNWSKLQGQMFGPLGGKRFGAVDFTKEVVIVVSGGNRWNCDGYSAEGVWESDARILLRLRRHTFQTIGGGKKTRPYGVFVMPRRAEKAYVVERNRQNLILGPPLWTEHLRARIGVPADELEGLPPATEARHEGWEKPAESPPPPVRPPR